MVGVVGAEGRVLAAVGPSKLVSHLQQVWKLGCEVPAEEHSDESHLLIAAMLLSQAVHLDARMGHLQHPGNL